MERVRVRGVPNSVTWQVIGEHSGDKVLHPDTMPVDESGPHEFVCTKLVHFTENEFARSIGLLDTDQPFCFKPFPWQMTNETSPLKLTWWSPVPPDNWKKGLARVSYYSVAMDGPRLCGPIGFVVTWKDILEQYVRGRQKASSAVKLELRNLGTYLYTREIMYAVLVCIEGDIKDNRFPKISPSDETEAIRFTGESYTDDFIWKVHTVYRNGTWDHLTFAFNCPESDFNIKPKFFSIKDKEADKLRPKSRNNSQNRTSDEMLPCKDSRLEEKIQEAKNASNRLNTLHNYFR